MLNRDSFTHKLAQNVRKVRESKKMSQEELADKAGLYRTYVGHIENGRYTPSSYVLYKIATALNVSVNEIYPR